MQNCTIIVSASWGGGGGVATLTLYIGTGHQIYVAYAFWDCELNTKNYNNKKQDDRYFLQIKAILSRLVLTC